MQGKFRWESRQTGLLLLISIIMALVYLKPDFTFWYHFSSVRTDILPKCPKTWIFLSHCTLLSSPFAPSWWWKITAGMEGERRLLSWVMIRRDDDINREGKTTFTLSQWVQCPWKILSRGSSRFLSFVHTFLAGEAGFLKAEHSWCVSVLEYRLS